MRKSLCALFAVLLALLCAGPVLADPVQETPVQEAADISSQTKYTGSGFDSFKFLYDKMTTGGYFRSSGNAVINLKNEEGMYSIYLLFHLEYGEYTITDNTTGQTFTAGKNRFLHEYIDLVEAFGTAPTSLTIRFDRGSVRISELYVFSEGEPPAFVQRWSAPLEGNTDLMLLSTHGDDEQLFFAGLLPKYAKELGYRVQVVYMTNHRSATLVRTHEMLDGLWAVGVDVYPVFGTFADVFIESLAGTYYDYSLRGVYKEDVLEFVVEQLRRFKPLVVVGHDINGEYGHGMHMMYTDNLIDALDIIGDPTQFPESANAYGVWEVPKTYLHLYEENPVVIDYDSPLESFGGMTAFEVTQKLGFPCHDSQQWTWFYGWIYGKGGVKITKATEIATYNPCLFGLYRSTVGEDVLKNDFMENIVSYAEQERLEQERLEQERLEQERLEQERLEQERLEQERLEQERLEQERLEQERLEQERLERERLEQERLEQERLAEQKRKQTTLLCAIGGMAVALIAIVAWLLIPRKNRRTQRKKK